MCYEGNMQTEFSHECEANSVNSSNYKSNCRKISLDSREDIIEYCKSIIHTQFYGEMSDERKLTRKPIRKSSLFTVGLLNVEKSRKFTEEELIIQIKKPSLTLGHLLRDLFNSLQRFATGKPLIDVIESLNCIAEARKQPGECSTECVERLRKQWPVFLEIREKAGLFKQKVDIMESHWGSRSQLRAGKVIADHVTMKELDPIYGVLLCPSAGQLENKEMFLHQQATGNEFDYLNKCERNNRPSTYHYIMQDAFSYLREAHGIGPGENYLDDYALFYSDDVVSGNMLALIFWERLINRIIEEELPVEIKTF